MSTTDARTDSAGEPVARILDLLDRFHVLVLACRDAQGSWAAPVFFAHSGLDLFFMSSPASRHARSLVFDRRLAGAIHGPANDWHAIVGLQISGNTQRLEADDVLTAQARYAARFPFADASNAGFDPALAKALQKAVWYRLRIDEAVIVDNAQGLGNRVHWTRPAEGADAPAAG